MDYTLNKNLNLKINGFHNSFENQIANSVANANLSMNIYSLTSTGIETDLQFVFSQLSGFLNYSFSQRPDETVLDDTIDESKNKQTWVPARRTEIGLVIQKRVGRRSIYD